jgi:drug/metabolite transporter (DMT)-like permease
VLAAPTGGGRYDGVGIAMLFIAPASWAVGSIYARGAPLPGRPLTAAACEMTAVIPVFLLIAGARGEFGELGHVHPSWRSIIALAYLISIGSLAGFSAYVWLLASAPVSLVATYAFVNPIVAVILGRFFLDEKITPRVVAASVVIVAAVALIVTGQARLATPVAEPEQ